jgi:hypothetical protein
VHSEPDRISGSDSERQDVQDDKSDEACWGGELSEAQLDTGIAEQSEMSLIMLYGTQKLEQALFTAASSFVSSAIASSAEAVVADDEAAKEHSSSISPSASRIGWSLPKRGDAHQAWLSAPQVLALLTKSLAEQVRAEIQQSTISAICHHFSEQARRRAAADAVVVMCDSLAAGACMMPSHSGRDISAWCQQLSILNPA